MHCVNCGTEIPANSRFCLNCGTPQLPKNPGEAVTSPLKAVPHSAAADGGIDNSIRSGFKQSERERLLNAAVDLDLEARERYNIGGRSFGCLATGFFVLMGIIIIIPAVPLLAFFGIPAAVILALLTYRNVGRFQDKVRSIQLLRKLPGFRQNTREALALAVFVYLVAASGVSILLLMVQFHSP